MDNALKFYEKVEQFPKSSVYPYAVYKKGWCYVNLGDYKTALETFVGVVRMTTRRARSTSPRRRATALEKEAKKDIVKAYAARRRSRTRPGSSSSARAATTRRR